MDAKVSNRATSPVLSNFLFYGFDSMIPLLSYSLLPFTFPEGPTKWNTNEYEIKNQYERGKEEKFRKILGCRSKSAYL